MSAQDDVLAAFGEPRRPVVEQAAVVEAEDAAVVAVEAGEAVAETVQPAVEAEEPVVEVEESVAEVEESAVEAEDVAVETEQPTTEAEAEAEDVTVDAEEAAAEAEQPAADLEEPTAEAVAPSVSDEPAAIETAEQTAPAQALPEPAQLYLDPSAFFTQLQAESAPEPKRRRPRLLLRYASALVLAGAVGAGTAYAVTLPKRTDIPTLATPSDGRYEFPVIAKVAPPVGKPGPGEESNGGQVHYADLRQYLLPVPKGAVLKEDGWESATDFVSGMESASLTGQLNDAGLRRIAWRGWTSKDGQHMVVELFQFPDHSAAYALEAHLASAVPQKVGKAEDVVPEYTVPGLGDTTENLAVRRFDTVEGLAGQIARRAVFRSGDVVVAVTDTAPPSVSDVSIDQVLLLQAEMLQ